MELSVDVAHIPIIIVSAREPEAYAERAINEGHLPSSKNQRTMQNSSKPSTVPWAQRCHEGEHSSEVVRRDWQVG